MYLQLTGIPLFFTPTFSLINFPKGTLFNRAFPPLSRGREYGVFMDGH
jgi:hypothetical protein